MANIRISDLPTEAAPSATDVAAIDGTTTRKTTLEDLVAAGRPLASQAEAEAGTDNAKAMTALRTAQAITSQGSSQFATFAQGAKADTAVQPGDLATVATTGAYSDLSGTPTLGTAAAEDISAFATFAQGAKADTAVQPGADPLIPTGGTAGQVLAKTSGTDFDVEWATSPLVDGSVTDAKISSASKLYNRIQDLPSVKDYGAVGDGVTDDTAALQAALDDDRVVAIPRGRYRTTSTLIADPTRNRGNGFVGLTTISLYPDQSQGSGPTWDGTEEAVIWYDGPSDDDLTSTSATSTTVGTGSKSFTTATGKAYAAAMEIVIRRTSDANATYMYGTVTSYDSGTGALVVDVDAVAGSGTHSDWSINAPTAVVAVKAGVPLTIEPTSAFYTTPYGFTLHQVICHGNEKAKYGFYSARLQDGNLHNVIGYRCKGDGFYINGSYSGNYSSLLGYRNWGRGVSIGAADYDYGWTAQGAVNRVTFVDTWGYRNGRAGEYDEADTSLRLKGCGIFFGPHRGSSLIGWTAELNDGIGLVYAPTSQGNIVLNGYTELNSSNNITGSGSAISTGRATEQRGVLFYGAAGHVSWGNNINGLYMAAEKLWLSGTEPSSSRAGLIVDSAFGNGTAAGWKNYYLQNCAVELIDTVSGERPHTHGDWTPTLSGASTAGSQTYAVQQGSYEVNNDVVTARFTIILTAFDAATAGKLQVTGLPFAAKAFPSSNIKYSALISEFIFKATITGRPVGFVQGGSSVISLRKDTGSGNTNTNLVPSDVDGSFRLSGEVRYRIR